MINLPYYIIYRLNEYHIGFFRFNNNIDIPTFEPEEELDSFHITDNLRFFGLFDNYVRTYCVKWSLV